jgi:hypothetical protein
MYILSQDGKMLFNATSATCIRLTESDLDIHRRKPFRIQGRVEQVYDLAAFADEEEAAQAFASILFALESGTVRLLRIGENHGG